MEVPNMTLLLFTLLGMGLGLVDVSVEDIRAHPFCEEEGRVGNQDLLSDSPPVLWNSVIGAGDIECSSNATLVVIALNGPENEYIGETRLTVSVAYELAQRDSIVESTHWLGVTTREGKYFVPVWLDETGCIPIRVRAWIENQEVDGREEIIAFRCGE